MQQTVNLLDHKNRLKERAVIGPAPAATPGWYPGPDGVQRYWDGKQWLEVPPPDAGAEFPKEANPEEAPGPSNRSRKPWIAYVVGAVAVLGLVGGGMAWKSSNDAQQAAVAAAQQQASEQKAKEDQEKAAQEAKDSADAEQREARQSMVKEIEGSIKAMAKKHVKEDLLDGPILSVTCDPVTGGSLDDLSEKTTVFQCFVANEDNKDGTLSGVYYHATMNWDTEQYTYGYGEP